MVLHAAILNNRQDYMKEYVDRGMDINTKDFAEWTPLHCAAYTGNDKCMKYLLQRQYIYLHEKNDEGKTALQLAIEIGHVFGDENVCTSLLEKGTELEEDIWHKLLILALNHDIVAYPRLAHKAGVCLHNCKEETKISLHKAVCCYAFKILQFYSETFPHDKLVEMIKESDF